jgi:hypothetical protein
MDDRRVPPLHFSQNSAKRFNVTFTIKSLAIAERSGQLLYLRCKLSIIRQPGKWSLKTHRLSAAWSQRWFSKEIATGSEAGIPRADE